MLVHLIFEYLIPKPNIVQYFVYVNCLHLNKLIFIIIEY